MSEIYEFVKLFDVMVLFFTILFFSCYGLVYITYETISIAMKNHKKRKRERELRKGRDISDK